MTPSDEGTPQTDAASKQWPEADARDGRFIFSGVSVELVSADFARQLERELQAARSDLEGFKNMLQAVTTDRNPNGKTLVDFFNCWLDQERDASAILRARLQEATARAERAEEALREIVIGKIAADLDDGWLMSSRLIKIARRALDG